MNCRHAHKEISADIDNALSGERQEDLARHLGGCPDCRRHKEELLSLLSALRPPALIAPSPHFLLKVRRRIRGQQQAPLLNTMRWAAAVTTGTVLVVALLTGNFFGTSLWTAATQSPDYEVASSLGLGAFADDPEESITAHYTDMRG